MSRLILLSLFLCFSICTGAIAQVRPELFQEEENFGKLSNDELKTKPEITLKDEAMISNFNSSTGIKDSEYYTGKDKHMLAGAYHVNPNITKISDLSSFEVSYAYKVYSVWAQAILTQTAGKFDGVSENKDVNAQTTNTNSEYRFQRPYNSKETILSYGVGVGYRFRMIYEWIKFDNMFETIGVYAMKHALNESYRDLSYNGYGFRADYGIHKRAGQSFFYGIKGSYNIGKVTRSLEEGESKADGSLALSWISMGFQVGYWF